MVEVIDLAERARAFREMIDEEADTIDSFLLNEGLDLLAVFRSIHDPAKRTSLFEMVKLVAEEERFAV